MMKIALPGITGRMGQALAKAVLDDSETALAVATARSEHSMCGKALNQFLTHAELNSNPITILPEMSKFFDVAIDFTPPEVVMKNLAICLKHQKPMVIGTTGFNDTQLQAMKNARKDIPVLLAANMSLGVNLCYELLKQAAVALGADWDVSVSEIHHKHKKDSPSGTALQMGAVVAEANNQDLSSIPFNSIRAGDVAGEHTVLFAAEGERLEITHKATNRMTFALGAVKAAKFLLGKKPAFYDMKDVIKLNLCHSS